MPFVHIGLHMTNLPGLLAFVIVWIGLFEFAHLLIALLRGDRLIGWAIGPFGISILFLNQPSNLYVWLNALIPACISAATLYLGLFTSILPNPLELPRYPLLEWLVVLSGVFLTSTGDLVAALRDVQYPLWGQARILRHIQYLRSSWARIHFTRFGLSYLHDQFGENPLDLFQAI